MASFKPVFRPQLLQQAVSHNLARPAFTQAAHSLTRRQDFSSSPPRPSRAADAAAARPPQVPAPTPFCPDVPTFLKLIGRGLGSFAPKIPSWEALFTLKSEDLRELGVEPARTRRYLNKWRQQFREGRYGVGGECQHVQDGIAHLRVVTLESAAPAATNTTEDVEVSSAVWKKPRRYVVNVPAEQTETELKAILSTNPETLCRVKSYSVKGAGIIRGPFALPLTQGQGSTLTVTENMWEDKRGRKIDGGERRRTEIRYKKRIQERREARERGEL